MTLLAETTTEPLETYLLELKTSEAGLFDTDETETETVGFELILEG